jgi:hypothetical protein
MSNFQKAFDSVSEANCEIQNLKSEPQAFYTFKLIFFGFVCDLALFEFNSSVRANWQLGRRSSILVSSLSQAESLSLYKFNFIDRDLDNKLKF